LLNRLEDSHGRKINYLRISVTDRCNQRCKYCMPESGIGKLNHMEILRNEEIISFVKVAAEQGIDKIRITGGEPLVKKGILDLISGIKKIDGIKEIGLTTNGQLLKEFAFDLKSAGINRINVSLDSLNPEKYRYMTRGGVLAKVLNGITKATEAGLTPIKVNTVLIGGFNDNEINDFMTFAKKNNIIWRLIELMPIGEVSNWSNMNYIDGATLLNNHPELTNITKSSLEKDKTFYNKNLDISIKLINSLTGKFCESCNRIRLTSDGKLKPCLHSNIEYDIKPFLNDLDKMTEFYKEIIIKKPKEHKLDSDDFTPINRNMNKIGG